MVLDNGMVLNAGLGFFVGKDNLGRDVYMSSGSTKGGSASVIAYPKLDLVVAAVCNQGNEEDNLPVFKIAGYFSELLDPIQKDDKKENAEQSTKENQVNQEKQPEK